MRKGYDTGLNASRRTLLFKALIFAAGVGFTAAFIINWCDLIYRCGCTFQWAGGADHCNIHNPSPPHCPWCSEGGWGAMAYGFILFVQGVVAFAPGRAGWKRIVGVFVASPLAAALAGLVIGLWTGYWTN